MVRHIFIFEIVWLHICCSWELETRKKNKKNSKIHVLSKFWRYAGSYQHVHWLTGMFAVYCTVLYFICLPYISPSSSHFVFYLLYILVQCTRSTESSVHLQSRWNFIGYHLPANSSGTSRRGGGGGSYDKTFFNIFVMSVFDSKMHWHNKKLRWKKRRKRESEIPLCQKNFFLFIVVSTF